MHIGHRESAGVVILDLEGPFVVQEGVDPFVEKMNALIRQGKRRILLNFSGVTALDRAGVGALAWKFATTRRQSGDVRLLHVQPYVAVLEATKLLTIIKRYEAEAEAIESFFADPRADEDDPVFT